MWHWCFYTRTLRGAWNGPCALVAVYWKCGGMGCPHPSPGIFPECIRFIICTMVTILLPILGCYINYICKALTRKPAPGLSTQKMLSFCFCIKMFVSGKLLFSSPVRIDIGWGLQTRFWSGFPSAPQLGQGLPCPVQLESVVSTAQAPKHSFHVLEFKECWKIGDFVFIKNSNFCTQLVLGGLLFPYISGTLRGY